MRLRLLIITVVVIAGCVSLETLAPPVDATWSTRSADVTTLQSGRLIYITKCAQCHTVQSVDDFALDEWNHILPDMAKESKLTADEKAQVQSYIAAALDKPAKSVTR